MIFFQILWECNFYLPVVWAKLTISFGKIYPKPVFIFKKIKVEGSKLFGKTTEHLELSFKNSKNLTIRAIGFFMNKKHDPEVDEEVQEGDISEKLRGKTIDLVASMEMSYFRREPELRLRIIDIIY